MKLICLCVGAIAGALLLAGCGGGGDDSGGDKTISKQEFIAKADAICKKGTERMQVAFLAGIKGTANLTKVSKAEQEKLVGSAIVPSVEREVKELRSIGIPDGDEEKVDAMIGALEEGAETAKRDPGAVADSSDAVFGIASRIAGEYGLKDCGIR